MFSSKPLANSLREHCQRRSDAVIAAAGSLGKKIDKIVLELAAQMSSDNAAQVIVTSMASLADASQKVTARELVIAVDPKRIGGKEHCLAMLGQGFTEIWHDQVGGWLITSGIATSVTGKFTE